MDQKTFVNLILSHCRERIIMAKSFRLVAARELGPCVLIIEDDWHDVDIYYHRELWEFRHPKGIRGTSSDCRCPDPRIVHGYLMEFNGRDASPPARTIESATVYAKSHLHPRGDVTWFGLPVEVPLPT